MPLLNSLYSSSSTCRAALHHHVAIHSECWTFPSALKSSKRHRNCFSNSSLHVFSFAKYSIFPMHCSLLSTYCHRHRHRIHPNTVEHHADQWANCSMLVPRALEHTHSVQTLFRSNLRQHVAHCMASFKFTPMAMVPASHRIRQIMFHRRIHITLHTNCFDYFDSERAVNYGYSKMSKCWFGGVACCGKHQSSQHAQCTRYGNEKQMKWNRNWPSSFERRTHFRCNCDSHFLLDKFQFHVHHIEPYRKSDHHSPEAFDCNPKTMDKFLPLLLTCVAHMTNDNVITNSSIVAATNRKKIVSQQRSSRRNREKCEKKEIMHSSTTRNNLSPFLFCSLQFGVSWIWNFRMQSTACLYSNAQRANEITLAIYDELFHTPQHHTAQTRWQTNKNAPSRLGESYVRGSADGW